MKKTCLLLILLLACTIQEQPEPQNISIIPQIIPPIPQIEKPTINLTNNIDKYVIRNSLFSPVFTEAVQDNFGIIPVGRYDAKYQFDSITILVHIFRFSTREELEAVLNSDFYYIINLGATRHSGHTIALYLNQEDHRIAVWSSGTEIIYVETFLDFASREIIDLYLTKYPSDLKTELCIDSDGNSYNFKGTTTNVKVDSTIKDWTDTCMRDFELYKNKQYKSSKGLSEEDGLLEGRCANDPGQPGYIDEYACHRGCEDGACKLR